jgi:hypothetical protein
MKTRKTIPIAKVREMFMWMNKSIREALYFSKIDSELNDKIYAPIEKFEKKLYNFAKCVEDVE